MSKRDRKTLDETKREWMHGAGGSLAVRMVLRMLENLSQSHGDRFSIYAACHALNKLAEYACLIRETLLKAKQASDCQFLGVSLREYTLIRSLMTESFDKWPADLRGTVGDPTTHTEDELLVLIRDWNYST